MRTYFNEIDPFAAAWLHNLYPDDNDAIDTRSIADVRAEDLDGYDRCHFFAGIAGWDLALVLAGWPLDVPVWTGSCPCQPFSSAGKRKGTDDARHLWPEFLRLIAERRPPVVFGEQVASKDGRQWLAGVRADLEALGYSVGAADLCAAGSCAPHIRQRLYWVAYAERNAPEQGRVAEQPAGGVAASVTGAPTEPRRCGDPGRLGDALPERRIEPRECDGAEPRPELEAPHGLHADGPRAVVGLADGLSERLEGLEQGGAAPRAVVGGSGDGPWSDFYVIPCGDGKSRRVEPPLLTMVDGVSEGMGRVCPEAVRAFEEECLSHADACEEDLHQAMRDLWSALQQEAVGHGGVRGSDGVYQAPVLLAFLRQLQEQGWPFAQSLLRKGSQDANARLRLVRHDEEAARTSRQRDLDGQSPGEPSDLVRVLSSVLARHAQASWGEAFQSHAASVHPLIVGATNRVGRLRAYGNAIVPYLAAEFIRAAAEARGVRLR